MIFLEFLNHWKELLMVEKQQEILGSIKKEIYSPAVALEYVNRKDSDALRITNMKLAEDGSIRTYCYSGKEPVRMFPDVPTVNVTAIIKRLLPLIAKSLSRQNWFQRVITLLAIKYNFKILPEWFELVFSLYPVLLKEEHYSQPVKELRRVLRGKIDERLLDGFTLILESDSAYRYKFQDIIVLLDKNKLNHTFPAIKEIKRLFDILSSREICNVEDRLLRWSRISQFISIIIFLSPKIRKQVVSVLKELNLEELKLSVEDTYWVNRYGAYNYFGKNCETRKEENTQKYGEDIL